MSQQLSLLGARPTDPESSHEAAAKVDAKSQRRRVLEFMAAHPSWSITADDLFKQSLGSVQRNVWSKRLSELRQQELIRCTGFTHNDAGSKVMAFALTGAGARQAVA